MRIAAEGTLTEADDTLVVDVGGYDRLAITVALSSDTTHPLGYPPYVLFEASVDGSNWNSFYLVQSKQGADPYDVGSQNATMNSDFGYESNVQGGVGIYYAEPSSIIPLRWFRLRLGNTCVTGHMTVVVSAATWD